MHGSSIRAALAKVFQISLRPTVRNAIAAPASSTSTSSARTSSASFSTSPPHAAKKGGKARVDRRISRPALAMHNFLCPFLHSIFTSHYHLIRIAGRPSVLITSWLLPSPPFPSSSFTSDLRSSPYPFLLLSPTQSPCANARRSPNTLLPVPPHNTHTTATPLLSKPVLAPLDDPPRLAIVSLESPATAPIGT